MIGTYSVYQDGQLLVAVDNLITTRGRQRILERMSSAAGTWAGAVSVGVDDTAPAINDLRLGFEFGRGEVLERAAPSTTELFLKGNIPTDVEGEIRELGIVFGVTDDEIIAYILDFHPDAFDTVNIDFVEAGRVEVFAGQVDAGASSTTTAEINGVDTTIDDEDLGTELLLAYFDATNVDNIELRFINDGSNYFTHTFSPSAGYSVESWEMRDFDEVGSPSWEEPIVDINILVTATSSAGSVRLDGLRLSDEAVNDEHDLVSRAVLAEPVWKVPASPLEIEYTIDVGWGS